MVTYRVSDKELRVNTSEIMVVILTLFIGTKVSL
nr:MAG TPA: hypothetical protein [Caudoviricetes sp.]